VSLSLRRRSSGTVTNADPGSWPRFERTYFAIEGQRQTKHKSQNPERARERVKLDKKVSVKSYIMLNGSGCLNQPGLPRKQQRAATQTQLGLSMRVHRTTVARWLGRCPLFKIKGTFGGSGQGSSYSSIVPAGTPPDGFDPSDHWPAPLKDIAAENPGALGWLDEGKGFGGYAYGPSWAFDERAGHQLCSGGHRRSLLPGALAGGEQSEIKKSIEVSMGQLARMLSWRPETVRRAIAEWERLGVLSMMTPMAEKREDKTFFQARSTISYVPWPCWRRARCFYIERQRMLRAKQRAIRMQVKSSQGRGAGVYPALSGADSSWSWRVTPSCSTAPKASHIPNSGGDVKPHSPPCPFLSSCCRSSSRVRRAEPSKIIQLNPEGKRQRRSRLRRRPRVFCKLSGSRA